MGRRLCWNWMEERCVGEVGWEWKCVGTRRKSRDQDFSEGTKREGELL